MFDNFVETNQCTPEMLTDNALALRDYLLETTIPFLENADYIDPEDYEQIDHYRQALMSIEMQPGFPDNIIWPPTPQAMQ